MKAKDARKELEGLAGDELYKRARELYELEIDQLIYLRSQGRKPTVGVVESAVKQVADWFRKVQEGLPWSSKELPGNIVNWESSEAYVRNNLIDPKLTRWRERTQREVRKGTPLPILEAMTPGDLEAASGMMMAQVIQDAKKWGALNDQRNAFAEKYGLKICFLGVEKRFCEHQTTYVMDKDKALPTSVNDLVFVCALDKCTEEAT